MKFFASAAVGALMTFSSSSAFADAGPTLTNIQERGALNCTSHNGSYLGFAEVDDQGEWNGLDIDLCRAVATAIFGDPNAVNFVAISWAQRWPPAEQLEGLLMDIIRQNFGRSGAAALMTVDLEL